MVGGESDEIHKKVKAVLDSEICWFSHQVRTLILIYNMSESPSMLLSLFKHKVSVNSASYSALSELQ